MSTFAVAFVVYLVTIMSSVDSFLQFLCLFAGIGFIFTIILSIGMWMDTQNDEFSSLHDQIKTVKKAEYQKVESALNKWRNWSIVLFVVGSLNILVPTEKQAITIAAVAIGYEGVTTIVENDRVQEVGGKTLEYLEEWLDTKIKELNNKDQTIEEGN